MKTIEIIQISKDIQDYLEKELLKDTKPKNLMPMLIEKGYFNKDHREGLPLREILRDLDSRNKLYLIPQVRVDRKEVNRNWFFNPVNKSIQFGLNKLLIIQNEIANDKFNRYNSWEHCFKVFGNKELDNDYLALHLGFYLASWGMYRGSTGLLQKDYKVHIDAVQIIKKYHFLRSEHDIEKTIDDVIEVKNKLASYYNIIPYINSKGESKNITPTDTLISKILLGTLGCCPAFDQYFVDGVKAHKYKFNKFDKTSMELILDFIKEYQNELHQLQKDFKTEFNIQYPTMKLIDMYFWNEGFLWNEEKQKKVI